MAYPHRPYRRHRQVRPFILARGRTRAPTRYPLLVHSVVSASYDPRVADMLSEHERAVYAHACHRMSVAEVSANTGLSLGLVRVVLGDLAAHGRVTIHPATAGSADTDMALLERVLRGLQEL